MTDNQSAVAVSQRAREAARNFIGSWPRVSVPTYYEPALAESFARFERELSTNKDETIAKLEAVVKAFVAARLPDDTGWSISTLTCEVLPLARTVLTSTKKEG